jgi:hypothetical protein
MKRYEPATPIIRRTRLIRVERVVRVSRVAARRKRLALLDRRAA